METSVAPQTEWLVISQPSQIASSTPAWLLHKHRARYEASSPAICSAEERGTYFDYFIFILIKWQVSILMLLNLSSCGWEATGWNRPEREGRRRCHLVPGWSRMWANSALRSPFTSGISGRISSPLMATARLTAPASWGLLHKTRQGERWSGLLVMAEGPGQSQLEDCACAKWKPGTS